MKYKLPLVVVDNISVSRKFYEEVLNQKVILDFGDQHPIEFVKACSLEEKQ